MKRFVWLLLLVCIYQKAFCWGFFAHRRINYYAVFLLPPEMLVLYKPNIEFLSDHAVDPDKRRYAVAAEGPRHYIDMDKYGAFPYCITERILQKGRKDGHIDVVNYIKYCQNIFMIKGCLYIFIGYMVILVIYINY